MNNSMQEIYRKTDQIITSAMPLLILNQEKSVFRYFGWSNGKPMQMRSLFVTRHLLRPSFMSVLYTLRKSNSYVFLKFLNTRKRKHLSKKSCSFSLS